MVMDCARFCELTGSLARLLAVQEALVNKKKKNDNDNDNNNNSNKRRDHVNGGHKAKSSSNNIVDEDEIFSEWEFLKVEQLRWLLGFG
jgi:hypothetical protein